MASTSNLGISATLLTLSALAGCNRHPVEDVDSMTAGGGSYGDTEGGTGTGEPFDDTDGMDEGGVPGLCGGERIEAQTLEPNVMVVLDKSGSMTDEGSGWDHDGDPQTPEVSRWFSLHGIIAGLLADQEAAMRFGAVLFPAADAHTGSGREAACRVADAPEVALGSSRAAILEAIPDAEDPTDGGTPARLGVLNAVEHFVDVDPEGPRAIVLVTDGAANCAEGEGSWSSVYDPELEVAVRSAYEDLRIATYVVGIDIEPGVDPRVGVDVHERLDAVAVAGGVARDGVSRFYPAADHDALQSALDEVSARVECTIELSDAPLGPNWIDLYVDGEPVSTVDRCEGEDGWRFTTDAAPWDKVELCGSVCEDFRAGAIVQTELACPPEG